MTTAALGEGRCEATGILNAATAGSRSKQTPRGLSQRNVGNRSGAMVLASGDDPAGFDGVRRSSMLRAFRRWMAVLELDTSPRGQLPTQ